LVFTIATIIDDKMGDVSVCLRQITVYRRACLSRLYTLTRRRHLSDFALVIKSCKSTVRPLLAGTPTKC